MLHDTVITELPAEGTECLQLNVPATGRILPMIAKLRR